MINVSLIILNYNYQKFLKNCLESCFDQKTKLSFETIFVDDGSQDNSLKVAKSFKCKNYYICEQNNSGIEKSANFAFNQSRGEFVVRVDADDFLHKEYLESIFQVFKNQISFVYSNYTVVDPMSKKIKNINLPQFNKTEILNRGDFLATGTMYRKQDIKELNYYNVNKKNCGLENYELIIKLLLAKKKGFRVNKRLFFLRKHDKSLTATKQKKISNYGIKIFNKYNLPKYRLNKFNPTITR